MIPFSLNTLAYITQGRLIGTDLWINAVSTDTRHCSPDCLFIALKGERFDAHQFTAKATAAGAGALLVSQAVKDTIPQVIVKDTRLALGQLAAWVRQQAKARVVALTGSSGKSTVKEMTAAILRTYGETLATEGNLNNDIGVPLTLLNLTQNHDFAVIELGASQQGDIAYTVSLTQPDAALINNLAPAHLSGFGSFEGVAKAKGEIFFGLHDGGTAIFNSESHDFTHWQAALKGKQLWRFSIRAQENNDFYATEIQTNTDHSEFCLHTPRVTSP